MDPRVPSNPAFPLTDDMVVELTNYLETPKEISATAAISSQFYLFGKHLKRLQDRFLKATIRCEQPIIRNMLQNHPLLFLKKGNGKTDNGNLVDCTPLEYAFNVRDFHTIKDFVTNLNQFRQSEQQAKDKEALDEYLMQWSKKLSVQVPGYEEAYTKYIQLCIDHIDHHSTITLSSYSCKSAEIKDSKRRDAIKEMNKLEPNHEALCNAYLDYIDNFNSIDVEARKEKRAAIIKLESECNIQNRQYDLMPIIEAYNKYLAAFFTCNFEACKDFWCQVVGFFQLRMPRRYIDYLCDPQRAFTLPPPFSHPDVDVPPPSAKLTFPKDLSPYSNNVDLGHTIAIYWGDNGPTGMSRFFPSLEHVQKDLRFLLSVHATSMQQSKKLEQELLAGPSQMIVYKKNNV